METRAYSLYIGTYTKGDSRGIYRAEFARGALCVTGCTEAVNPSYLARRGGALYAVKETAGGSVASYRVEADGTLALTGEMLTGGDAPCHVCAARNHLYVSNYTSGSLAALALDARGALSSPARVFAHEGHGPNPARQAGPHAHQAQPTPNGRFLAVCDLGTDGVYFYPLDDAGICGPARRVQTPPGVGPRHTAFGDSEMWYLLGELSCDVLVYRGYGDQATLVERVSLLRPGDPDSAASALRLSPDGALLLASVRGANTLALLDVLADGTLGEPRWFDAGGDWPRDAAFTPDGRHVLCACEREHRVTVFAAGEGGLAPVSATGVPSPTCLCFG